MLYRIEKRRQLERRATRKRLINETIRRVSEDNDKGIEFYSSMSKKKNAGGELNINNKVKDESQDFKFKERVKVLGGDRYSPNKGDVVPDNTKLEANKEAVEALKMEKRKKRKKSVVKNKTQTSIDLLRTGFRRRQSDNRKKSQPVEDTSFELLSAKTKTICSSLNNDQIMERDTPRWYNDKTPLYWSIQMI